jgi:hypothetical protein
VTVLRRRFILARAALSSRVFSPYRFSIRLAAPEVDLGLSHGEVARSTYKPQSGCRPTPLIPRIEGHTKVAMGTFNRGQGS